VVHAEFRRFPKLAKHKSDEFKIMFTKIAKGLLKGDSSLNLIITREDDALLRVTAVVRDPKGSGDAKDSALLRGVTVVNTPEKLDETLGDELANYQAGREEVRASLAEVTEALKEEAAANRKKARQTRAKTGVTETAAAKAGRTGSDAGQLTLT
jgi:PRTRC genetic system protein E